MLLFNTNKDLSHPQACLLNLTELQNKVHTPPIVVLIDVAIVYSIRYVLSVTKFHEIAKLNSTCYVNKCNSNFIFHV